ncbi:MAG: flagellar protein FliS [Chitinispirillales bacterium]|jgi:flagellin-specific chaperone FliS|nr:flagellar protein FliS [Chitinispirillales bacterium]
MPTDTVAQYDVTRIRTTSLKGLVCLLHDRTLSFIKKGLEEGNRREIEKAQNLIFQLELAVNKNEDASTVLADLYAYCYYLLEKTDTQSVIVARKIIETLSEAFGQLAKYKKH